MLLRILPLLFLILGMQNLATAAETTQGQVTRLIDQRSSHFESLYREIHMHPELSGQEIETAHRLAKEWRNMGFEVMEGIGGGVVAILRNGPGPTALLRTELDALPIAEETALEYASRKPGVMHACGHDAHMAIITGTAYVLKELQKNWRGTLVLIGQPAEETARGAKAMIEDGLFRKIPKPDYALAIHVAGTFPSGNLLYRAGSVYASSDSVDVTFFGKSGHGALPHEAIDPFIQSAEFTLKLQTLIGREVDPAHPAVISVGSIQGGTKHNIIPDSVKMKLTVRTLDEQVRTLLRTRITEVAEGIAKTSRAPKPELQFSKGNPSTYNEPKLVEKLLPTLQHAVGAEHVHEIPPAMTSEDFGELGRQGGFPSFAFGIGSHDQASTKAPASNHSSKYAPAFKPTFSAGVLALSLSVIEMNAKKP